jgi:hypothetical protein
MRREGGARGRTCGDSTPSRRDQSRSAGPSSSKTPTLTSTHPFTIHELFPAGDKHCIHLDLQSFGYCGGRGAKGAIADNTIHIESLLDTSVDVVIVGEVVVEQRAEGDERPRENDCSRHDFRGVAVFEFRVPRRAINSLDL